MHEMLPILDSPPDEWGPDHDDVDITDEMVAAGNAMGAAINVDDDEDNGL